MRRGLLSHRKVPLHVGDSAAAAGCGGGPPSNGRPGLRFLCTGDARWQHGALLAQQEVKVRMDLGAEHIDALCLGARQNQVLQPADFAAAGQPVENQPGKFLDFRCQVDLVGLRGLRSRAMEACSCPPDAVLRGMVFSFSVCRLA